MRHAAKEYGVRALGVTLSRRQAQWATAQIAADGLRGLAEVRHLDYRDAPEGPYDAISSIGLTEHIGVRHYPAYFRALARRLRPGGRLLNHCITRPHEHQSVRPERFTDRYVFPDGELAPVTRVAAAGAVSYTHLDVYKRQVPPRLATAARPATTNRKSSPPVAACAMAKARLCKA